MFEISKLKTDRKTELDVYKALNTGMQTSSEKADVMEALWSESMKPFSCLTNYWCSMHFKGVEKDISWPVYKTTDSTFPGSVTFHKI